jgi:predicted nucleic acid-binding protein
VVVAACGGSANDATDTDHSTSSALTGHLSALRTEHVWLFGDIAFASRSTVVRGETWTFLRRRLGYPAAVGFLDSLSRSPRCEVTRVSPELDTQALTWLRQRDEREYSYVDATSFALMRQLRIDHALAFDGDFSAAGFVELRPGA